MEGRVVFDIDCKCKLCYVMEICYDSFVDEFFIKLLCKYKVVLVVVDVFKKWFYQEDVMVDFMYLCLYGDKCLYQSGYSDEVIDVWVECIWVWVSGGQL